jgi:hypothetical protein
VPTAFDFSRARGRWRSGHAGPGGNRARTTRSSQPVVTMRPWSEYLLPPSGVLPASGTTTTGHGAKSAQYHGAKMLSPGLTNWRVHERG